MTITTAVQIVEANINGHGLDLWQLREAEQVVLDELVRKDAQIEHAKRIIEELKWERAGSIVDRWLREIDEVGKRVR